MICNSFSHDLTCHVELLLSTRRFVFNCNRRKGKCNRFIVTKFYSRYRGAPLMNNVISIKCANNVTSFFPLVRACFNAPRMQKTLLFRYYVPLLCAPLVVTSCIGFIAVSKQTVGLSRGLWEFERRCL